MLSIGVFLLVLPLPMVCVRHSSVVYLIHVGVRVVWCGVVVECGGGVRGGVVDGDGWGWGCCQSPVLI